MDEYCVVPAESQPYILISFVPDKTRTVYQVIQFAISIVCFIYLGITLICYRPDSYTKVP